MGEFKTLQLGIVLGIVCMFCIMDIKRLIKLLAASLISIISSACDDLRIYSQYGDLNAAREDGAFERGWFPHWMPENAVDIHEFHDLDTNQQAISFRLKNHHTFEWPQHCSPSRDPIKPRLKTKLFPTEVHKLGDVKSCLDHYAVQDANGIFHMWSRD